MLDTRVARDRAVRFAITTGHMPNFDLIHSRQQAEGFQSCFGRCLTACEQSHCRWHRECTDLTTFEPPQRTSQTLRGIPLTQIDPTLQTA